MDRLEDGNSSIKNFLYCSQRFLEKVFLTTENASEKSQDGRGTAK